MRVSLSMSPAQAGDDFAQPGRRTNLFADFDEPSHRDAESPHPGSTRHLSFEPTLANSCLTDDKCDLTVAVRDDVHIRVDSTDFGERRDELRARRHVDHIAHFGRKWPTR